MSQPTPIVKSEPSAATPPSLERPSANSGALSLFSESDRNVSGGLNEDASTERFLHRSQTPENSGERRYVKRHFTAGPVTAHSEHLTSYASVTDNLGNELKPLTMNSMSDDEDADKSRVFVAALIAQRTYRRSGRRNNNSFIAWVVSDDNSKLDEIPLAQLKRSERQLNETELKTVSQLLSSRKNPLGDSSSSSSSSYSKPPTRSHAASQPLRIQPRRSSHSSAERLMTEKKDQQHTQKRKRDSTSSSSSNRSSSKKKTNGKRGGKKAKTTAGKENQDEKEDQDMPDAAAITTSTSSPSTTSQQSQSSATSSSREHANAPQIANSPDLMKLLLATHARANFAEGQLYQLQLQNMQSEREAAERHFGLLRMNVMK